MRQEGKKVRDLFSERQQKQGKWCLFVRHISVIANILGLFLMISKESEQFYTVYLQISLKIRLIVSKLSIKSRFITQKCIKLSDFACKKQNTAIPSYKRRKLCM